MKKPIITAFAFGTLIMPAMAADLRYYKAPPPAPVIMSWTGFYIGANAGWIGSAENTITNTGTDTRAGGFGALLGAGAIPGSVGVSHSGFTGGGQIGYNWQWTPSWVLGLEADFDGLANANSTVIAAFPGSAIFVPLQTAYTRTLDDLGTVRARLGYLSSATLLWYVTGGLAYGQTKLQTAFACATCAPPANTSILTSNVNTGWTVGGGVEWMFAPAWSIKAEYLYADLGSISNTIGYIYGPTSISSLTSTFNERDNIVRVGINYKFW